MEESLEPKIYPKRKEEPIMYRVCGCLHGWSSHETNWPLRDGKCEKCECPKYKFYKRLSFEEWRKLQLENGVTS